MKLLPHLTARPPSFRLEDLQVISHNFQVVNRRIEPLHSSIIRLVSIEYSKPKLQKQDRTKRPGERNSRYLVQDVETGQNRFCRRHRQSFEFTKNGCLFFSVVRQELLSASTFNGVNASNRDRSRIHCLRKEVRQQEVALPPPGRFGLIVDRARNSICRSTHDEDSQCSDSRNNDRQSAKECTPCLPPNSAVLRQRPALANPIQHAHSLIPLWIGRHFAMRARNPLAALPQGVE
jgi:hypothetical protein